MKSDEPIERSDAIHADLLSAAWLALYFLGAPFNKPWERALEIADRQGGFAWGACIHKAVGDVYRTSRRFLAPRQGTSDHRSIVVLARQPAGLIPMDKLPIINGLDKSITMLGRCYLTLQMRLYVRKNLPITYIVPLDALKVDVDEINWGNGKETDPWRAMANWSTGIFGTSSSERQRLILVKGNAADGIPTCLLGSETSLYSVEGDLGGKTKLPISGNRIEHGLANSYRTKLASIVEKGEFSEVMQWTDANHLARSLRSAAKSSPTSAET